MESCGTSAQRSADNDHVGRTTRVVSEPRAMQPEKWRQSAWSRHEMAGRVDVNPRSTSVSPAPIAGYDHHKIYV